MRPSKGLRKEKQRKTNKLKRKQIKKQRKKAKCWNKPTRVFQSSQGAGVQPRYYTNKFAGGTHPQAQAFASPFVAHCGGGG